MPTASEVLSVMDRLERDPEQRRELMKSYDIFRACVSERIVGEESIDWLAQRMQQLHGEGLIAHGPVSGGGREPPVWDGQWIQMMHDWRVTADGRADAALHDSRRKAATKVSGQLPDGARDVFICHAGEDKKDVARPLAAAMNARGWSVWLDELELSIGDSLSGGIDAALAQSRFGIVVLSRAFFGKPWPERELAGLAAREVVAGSKVILPVWHGIDAEYIAARSPVLADRLGASTKHGIESVADQLSRALIRAGLRGAEGDSRETVIQGLQPAAAGGVTMRGAVDPRPRLSATEQTGITSIRWDQLAQRPEPGEEEIPLEPWLEDRIAAHAELVRQRAVRGDTWFFQALGKWDVRNTHELLTKVAPDLVDGYYRGDGVPGYVPGQEEAYYNRQLAWLKDTLHQLRASHPPSTDTRAWEVVTPESIARELEAFVPLAGQMLRGTVTRTQVENWASSVGVGIRARGPDREEDMFLAEGCHFDPPGELRAKVTRLQNHILPKVRAGEWTRPPTHADT
jgi:TIR domain-containing protein